MITPLPVEPFAFRTARVAFLDEDEHSPTYFDYFDFSLHVGAVAYIPNVSRGVFRSVDGSLFGSQDVTWDVSLMLAQDITPDEHHEDEDFGGWEQPITLMNFLNSKFNKRAYLYVLPEEDFGGCIFCEVLIAPVQIGGDVTTGPLSSTVTMLATMAPEWLYGWFPEIWT